VSAQSLFVAYVAVGLVGAAYLLRSAPRRTRETYASAGLLVALWPLWAPFAFAPRGAEDPARPLPYSEQRFQRALAEAVALAAGTPLEAVFSRQIAARIEGAALRALRRVEALAAFAHRGHTPHAASRRVRDLEAQGVAPRVVASARLQSETAERLAAVVARDEQALAELAELLEALCTHLAIARHAGAGADGIDGLVTEVWARLEVLGTTLDA
jgi:hypothetical protein